MENNVAYLRVSRVANGLAAELQSAQTALAATNKISGTVLDLRFADGDDLGGGKGGGGLCSRKNNCRWRSWSTRETRGAAATLAAELREAHAGLVLGGTAGELKPDIAVTVKPCGRKTISLKIPTWRRLQSGTNTSAATNGNLATFIDHTSEADLVRDKIKDGEQDEDSLPPRPTEPQTPFIHDPALARAVDLIKALAVVRQNHA